MADLREPFDKRLALSPASRRRGRARLVAYVPSPPEGGEGQGEVASPSAIERALDALDPDDDAHWTLKGLPSISALCAVLKRKALSRAEIHVTRPSFDRETARQACRAGLVRTVRQRMTARRPV
jgi:hypothetical protein